MPKRSLLILSNSFLLRSPVIVPISDTQAMEASNVLFGTQSVQHFRAGKSRSQARPTDAPPA